MTGRAACICGARPGERHVPLCEAFGANVLNLDLTQEDRPDSRWLRQLAETLKLEADVLSGHAQDGAPSARPRMILTASQMAAASAGLIELADVLDAAPSDPLLPRVNSSLADTAPLLPPSSHAGGGPGTADTVAGPVAVDDLPPVGRRDLEGGS